MKEFVKVFASVLLVAICVNAIPCDNKKCETLSVCERAKMTTLSKEFPHLIWCSKNFDKMAPMERILRNPFISELQKRVVGNKNSESNSISDKEAICNIWKKFDKLARECQIEVPCEQVRMTPISKKFPSIIWCSMNFNKIKFMDRVLNNPHTNSVLSNAFSEEGSQTDSAKSKAVSEENPNSNSDEETICNVWNELNNSC